VLPIFGAPGQRWVVSFHSLTGPIRPHRNPQCKRLKIGRIGRLNARLTGKICGSVLNLVIELDIVVNAAKDWPVNRQACVT
jgi:hypothetical protein